MAVLSWILSLLCVAGCHRSSASPVRGVQVGQNVTLTCNLTSSEDVTWYLLRSGSDQLLPLLTLSFSKLEERVVAHHSANISHMSSGGGGDQETDPITLEIMEVEEQDRGMYFCSARRAGVLWFNRATLLSVDGADGTSATDETGPPCWSVGICVLPAALVLVLVLVLFLGSGKPAVCSCRSGSRAAAPRVTEDDSLHYSSLKPRPPGQRPARLVEKDVTYSAVRVAKTQRDRLTAERRFHCHLPRPGQIVGATQRS
ncbi:uncharacterized protein LOC124855051 [Hippoglossus stenolepis]|uniref:uncharacterized protein LOC124855051 n=1 Tax=Hippoglossus stenolepis TaxID=195615 RepID=UPI001FAF79B5|nr:uncharacterized protein LOC124855051 [Hippoglossus stenolepis]